MCVLAPIIGKSEITDVSITVDDYAAGTQPVAFTVKIPSPKDGALISTNYFPAYIVAADPTGNTTAPTILNGPGLATAGNIDPTAADTVDGLVPGLNFMRSAGYNVVTWDPRGEFDSGGILQLDSPAYEGQDVTGIINWLSDNVNYTHQQFDPQAGNPGDADDPAIGMVGGSYGGGIQLVTAGIDPRVDVIVPGIAWNSLLDSLYTNEAFKTSYSSLLLLGFGDHGLSDQSADLWRDHHRCRSGHPHPSSAGAPERQRPGFLSEHRHSRAVHPGNSGCVVPACAG